MKTLLLVQHCALAISVAKIQRFLIIEGCIFAETEKNGSEMLEIEVSFAVANLAKIAFDTSLKFLF